VRKAAADKEAGRNHIDLSEMEAVEMDDLDSHVFPLDAVEPNLDSVEATAEAADETLAHVAGRGAADSVTEAAWAYDAVAREVVDSEEADNAAVDWGWVPDLVERTSNSGLMVHWYLRSVSGEVEGRLNARRNSSAERFGRWGRRASYNSPRWLAEGNRYYFVRPQWHR